MKKNIYIAFSVLLMIEMMAFLIIVTLPWTEDPSVSLPIPLRNLIMLVAHIGIPSWFLCRALFHEEPPKYKNEVHYL